MKETSEISIFPKWIWVVIISCFVLSFPFYLPKELAMSLTLGLPTWVVLSVAWVAFLAIFIVWVIHKYWKDE